MIREPGAFRQEGPGPHHKFNHRAGRALRSKFERPRAESFGIRAAGFAASRGRPQSFTPGPEGTKGKG